MQWATTPCQQDKHGSTQDGVFTDGARVLAGWAAAADGGAVALVWSCSGTGVDLRTIPMALCSVSLDTRSSGRTYRGAGQHAWRSATHRKVN